jgi:predicted nucleic acid-binding protein
VLDTNVVLDLLHFDDTSVRPLRDALEDGRVRCAVTGATLDELRRVLAYPEFALAADRQAALFARYQMLSVEADFAGVDAVLPHKGAHCGLTTGWDHLPRCSDPDDQKFIELAAAARAQGLISKDRALLRLRRRCAPLFWVMTPADAVRQLLPGAGAAA